NQFCRRSDYPAQYDAAWGDDPDEVVCRGGSCIVDPLGQIIAGPDFQGETILCAELDMGEIARGKFDFDVVGHYARPDVFQLQVNEQPRPVTVVSAAVTETESD
ncbi:MAG: nitrilase, partial [Chloroflexi bacterium]|nr:nitrilase [Chloroflexota bacterium]